MSPPPGWNTKLYKLLEIYTRAQDDMSARGQAKAKIAYRLLQALLSQRP